MLNVFGWSVLGNRIAIAASFIVLIENFSPQCQFVQGPFCAVATAVDGGTHDEGAESFPVVTATRTTL